MPASAADLLAPVRGHLAAARVARLATVTEAGRPHLVPIVFTTDGDELVTAVDDKPKTTRRLARLRHIAANPAVCVLIDHYEEDWSRLWWVRIDGTAALHEPGSARHSAGAAALRAAYAEHYRGTDLGTLIAITPTAVRSWGVT